VTSPLIASQPGSAPLADFSYLIRGPHHLPHLGVIEAVPMTAPTVVKGSFEDAVAAAQAVAQVPAKDPFHALPIQPAQAVIQASDGAFMIAPLGGLHREKVGPLFVDGVFFDRTALGLQVSRRSPELLAIVGAARVLDLRDTGGAVVSA
jgi:hypothetical protein